MDEAKRETANKLAVQIKELKEHLYIIENAGQQKISFYTRSFTIEGDVSKGTRRTEYGAQPFYPKYYNEEEFYLLYILRAKQHLAELEKQFADL